MRSRQGLMEVITRVNSSVGTKGANANGGTVQEQASHLAQNTLTCRLCWSQSMFGTYFVNGAIENGNITFVFFSPYTIKYLIFQSETD